MLEMVVVATEPSDVIVVVVAVVLPEILLKIMFFTVPSAGSENVMLFGRYTVVVVEYTPASVSEKSS